MSEILVILIDDENREFDVKTISENNSKVNIVYFHPYDFIKKSDEYPDVSLFLIDYKLSQIKNVEDKLYPGKGFSYSGIIREKYFDAPIFLFSNDVGTPRFNKLDKIAEKYAEKIISWDSLLSEKNIIYSDIIDFNKIKENIGNKEDLLGLLNPPEKEVEKISQILPTSLKQYYKTENTDLLFTAVFDFYQWILSELMCLPGFLYDSLYASTKIGMTEDTFRSKEAEFITARYNGIFSDSIKKPLWWQSKLYNLIIQKSVDKSIEEKTSNPKLLSKFIFELDESKIPICHFCNEKYPDTLGLNLYDNKRYPVHYRCSQSNENIKKRLFFDELREFYKEK